MRTDDPRLEKAREEMTGRVKKYDERMLTVIKNHLGCEDFLNALMSAASRSKKGKFAGKIDIAEKEIKPPEVEPVIWKLLCAGNKLRNAVAHGFDESKIAARMADFRKAYLAALSPEQAKDAQGLDDIRLIVLAFGLCGAYLVIAADNERGRRSAGRRRSDH